MRRRWSIFSYFLDVIKNSMNRKQTEKNNFITISIEGIK